MAEYRLNDEDRENLAQCVTRADLFGVVELILHGRVRAAEKRADDLAAAVAALAYEEPRLRHSLEQRTAIWKDGHALRAAVSDPAAVLADRDARVKAEAWDEGRRSGRWGENTRNPYREGQA